MPRPARGARLYLHPTERVWLIRDGAVTRRTGCHEGDRRSAERLLGEYIGKKFSPVTRESHSSRITVAEILTAYGREHAPNVAAPARIGFAIAALGPWWGGKMLSEVKGTTCRAYATQRTRTVGAGTVRRELGVLSAAINHWHREHGPLESIPVVTLPQKPSGRERWLRRSEAARLLAGALGFYEAKWCDVATKKVQSRWQRHRGAINRHAARFVLLGLYTGTRHRAVLGVQWMPNTTGGWIDLDRGVMHRRGLGRVETKKRQPAVKLGRRILAHLARWNRLDTIARETGAKAHNPAATFLHVVSYEGKFIDKITRAWRKACEFGQLPAGTVPHILRHTRATWMMQQGVDPWEASGALGMSVETLQNVYGHHHPDWQTKAAEV